MFKCHKCGKSVSGFGERIAYSLNNCMCSDCVRKEEVEDKRQGIIDDKENKAIEMLSKYGIIIIDKNTISIDVNNTSLRGKIPKKHLDIVEHLNLNGYAESKENGKQTPIGKDLINKIIENNYDKTEIDELIESFFEKLLINIEAEKIKNRQMKFKIKQEAEKQVFGKISHKKRIEFSEDEKESILDKFNHECAICGANEGLHIHHKDQNPQNNQLSNLIVLCGVCHKKVHMKVR